MFDLLGFMNTTLTAPFLFCLALLVTVIVSLLIVLVKNQSPKNIYMLDFACYKPPESQTVTKQGAVEIIQKCFGSVFKEETLEFMRKTIEKSGLGDCTYLPEGFFKYPADTSLDGARKESEMAIFVAVDELLANTGVKCGDIGIVVVNCCLFSVAPSLCSVIVNRYKMKDSVASYNLTGMGCTAGLVAVSLAKQLLQVHHNSYALVVSTEILSQSCYTGNERSKFIINCVFRVGGAAILLSNRPSDHHSSKYQLINTVRTHNASSDSSYNSITLEEDEEGHLGINVTKDLIVAAIAAIQSNLTSLAPLVLPVSEKFRYGMNYIERCLHVSNIKPYVPDFKKSFDHFLLHVGGKPVLDGLQRSLRLNEGEMEASRMTLFKFGNTSSSSVWYELAYAEAKGRVKRGDRVWQMAFGSGFKSCSIVWRAMRNVENEEVTNVWSDEIDGFPVDLQNIARFLYFSEPSKLT